jgi:hypothetical protein
MEQQAKFEGWAIVEMMGHQKEIGFVTTETYGQAILFRVDTPELPEREFILDQPTYINLNGWTRPGAKVKRATVPAHSRLVSPGALYAITPCTEEAARTALEHGLERPLILLEAPPLPALAAAEDGDDEATAEDGDDEDCLCQACGLCAMDCRCQVSIQKW